MKTIQVSAKTVEKAIKEGLEQLNATQDQVNIKILDQGGLFRKAKVELTLEELEQKEEPKAKKETKKESTKTTTKEEKKEVKVEVKKEEKKEEKETKKQPVNLDDARVIGGEFLKGLFNHLNIETVITSTNTEDGINYNVKGDKVSDLIGYRGETLNSIQYLLSIVLKNAGYKVKAYLDVQNYKKRREETLISLAERLARKAIKLNKPVELEPMNAYERRIIHSALTDNEQVTTHSEGEEPNRHLIITPKQ